MNTFINIEAVRAECQQYEVADGAGKSVRAYRLAARVPELLDGLDAFAAEVERLRAELNAIGDIAYRADPTDGEDALLVIQTRAKRAAGGA